MQINKNLNLVIPIDRDDGTTMYVHCVPIAYELFQRYYLLLSKTFAMIGQQGLGVPFAPKIAARLLEDIAKSTARAPGVDWWAGDDGVEKGLLGEIIRLSNLLVPTDRGWQLFQLTEAVRERQGQPAFLDQEEFDEVVNQAAFFTVVWRAAPRHERQMMVERAAMLYGGETTSLDCTAYRSSLTIPSKDETTAASVQTDETQSSALSSRGSRARVGASG